MLTHRNLLANIRQIVAWVGSTIHEGEEIVITALPLHHIFCLTVNCLCFLYFGGLNVLVTNPATFRCSCGKSVRGSSR